MGRTFSTIALYSLLSPLLAAPGWARSAQDTVAVGRVEPVAQEDLETLPRQVAERVVEFYNSERTIRLHGRTFIPDGRRLDGDVAILGGPVELGGRVAGDLVVINGDVNLRPTASVDGDVTVVGGRATAAEGARVQGEIVSYTSVLVVQRSGDRLVLVSVDERRRRRGRLFEFPVYGLGASDFLVTAGTYNRVEGLPISLGPRIVTGGSNPLRAEFLGIYRTVSGFSLDREDLGYLVRARQYAGGRRSFWLEASFHSWIEPIESWGVSDLETALSTLFLHRDYRDHYERRGFGVAAAWAEEDGPASLRLEYRDERHASVAVRDSSDDPWTLSKNDEPFRPNPRIHGGDLRSLLLALTYDTRNDRSQPWTGWWVRASYEVALGGDLSGREPDFQHLFVDLRRYNRVSPSSGLDVRIVAGGRLGGSFLPAQRQHALGAEGSLPGYQRFEFDCGVRDGGPLAPILFVPGYGCERVFLFQAQYRGSPRFRISWGGEPDEPGPDRFRLRLEPAFVIFYNAGAAWNGEGFLDHLTDTDNWAADVGVGVDFGGPGVYVALPLRKGAKGSNLFVRLARRL